MGFFYISLLAIIQGITEFLPVSSSGHLVVVSQIFAQSDHTLDLDISVHFGTLLAVILYYRKDVSALFSGFLDMFKLELDTVNAKLFRLLITATIPVILVGYILKASGVSNTLRSMELVGLTMIVFGFILLYADKYGQKHRDQSSWTHNDAIIMGLWQCLALVPGTSRSGATITSGLILGFSRESSTNLSMLMSIPTILASSTLLIIDLANKNISETDLNLFFLATLLSFLSALAALSLLIRFIRNKNFTPFVIYRVIVGLLILLIAYS